MRTSSIYLILVIFFSACQKSYPVTGYWEGHMKMNGKTVDISIQFNKEKSILSSNDLMLKDLAISDFKVEGSNASFSVILDAEMVFEGQINNNEIKGETTISGAPPNIKIDFFLKKVSDSIPSRLYSIEKKRIESSDGVILSAEIYKPKSNRPHPAIVLVHGSSLNNKIYYKFDADYFANLGFEVLIFDKRGTGESSGDLSASTYDDFSKDVITCLETLKKRENVDKTKIGLWGYSQGAMLLPFIVSKTEIPSFVIAKSPEIRSVVEASAFSDSLRVVSSGNINENGHIAAESHRKIGKMIEQNKEAKDLELFIKQNAEKHSFMNNTGLYQNIRITENDFNGYYWQDRVFNFYSYWEKLTVPALILFGEDDAYVDANRNLELINKIGNENISAKMFHRADHGLKKTFNPQKYPDFDWPRRVEGCNAFIENWLKNTIAK